MKLYISKSRFKPKIFEFFRLVENTHKTIYITDRGKTVLKIVPFSEEEEGALSELRGSVNKYEQPLEPVGLDEWELLK